MKQFRTEERYKDIPDWDEDAVFLHLDTHRVWHYPPFIREWMKMAQPGECLLASFDDCTLRIKCEEATNPEMDELDTVISIQNLSGKYTEISQDIMELSDKVYHRIQSNN